MNIEIPQSKYNNLTREERSVLYNLENDRNIKKLSIRVAGLLPGTGMFISKRLRNNLEIYEELCNDSGPLISTIHKAIEKVRKRGDMNADAIKCLMVKDPTFSRFYLLPKVYKRLHDVPGWCVISNWGYYNENISSFLEFHLQPFDRGVKSYIKDTIDFLKKLHFLRNLPDHTISCTVDIFPDNVCSA